METKLDYSLDLRDVSRPQGYLIVQQINRSQLDISCEIRAAERYFQPSTDSGDSFYNMDECYWGYLRVYLPKGSVLQYSNPHDIPAEASMFGEMIPARTDDLGNDDVDGSQAYGMMVLTPTRSSTQTEFKYLLPKTVLIKEGDTWVYRLTVQKQAGTLAHLFHFRVRFPDGAKIIQSTVSLTEDTGFWTVDLDLQKDISIEIRFTK